MQVFLQIIAFSLQTDGSGQPVMTKGKRWLTDSQLSIPTVASDGCAEKERPLFFKSENSRNTAFGTNTASYRCPCILVLGFYSCILSGHFCTFIKKILLKRKKERNFI